MPIEIVGVVGAGVMGAGLAQLLADKEVQTIVIDLDEPHLQKARERMKAAMRSMSLFRKNPSGPNMEQKLSKVRFSTDLHLLREIDIAIENIPEKWELKRSMFQELDSICPPRCILASNTSAIPIEQLAACTKRADRVVGMHFMNPVPMTNMVEVIRAPSTSEDTLERCTGFLQRLERNFVVVKDSPGFVTNRVLMLTLNEAMKLVEEDVAAAEAVDQLFRTCFGHKMGPLETADLIGLDTVLYSLEVLQQQFSDVRFAPCQLLKSKVQNGELGRKSEQGFYSYRLHPGA